MKAAVVGLGIGMAHVAGYLESTHTELYAVCDLIPERLAKVGGTFEQGNMLCLKPLFNENTLKKNWQELNVKTFTSIDELLMDDEIDILSICTPDYLHAKHAEKVIRSGKHLLLEKPVDIILREAERFGSILESSDRKFCLGYEFRMNPAVQKMKEYADSGSLGTIEAFSLYHFRTPFRKDKWQNWIQTKEKSGGLIVEETCHWFDLARYITGKELESIHCVTTDRIYKDVNFEDIAYINGTFKNGGILQISHALTGFDFSLQLTLHGKKGTVWCGLKEEPYSSLDNGKTDYLGIVSFGKPGGLPKEAEVFTWGDEATEPWNIMHLTKDFAARISEGRKPICNLNDGIESLKLSLLAGESARDREIKYIK
jgi:UDP-N-acetyl-2-amino-2-deoxyglucuronate dehydrogenase